MLNPYSLLLGLAAWMMLHIAWHELREERHDKARPLGLCGLGMGGVACLFAYLL
jgi:hypothetical protein